MKKTKIIGLSASAGGGKDTFANIFKNECEKLGKSVEILSLAQALKQDCEHFLHHKFGYDVWTEDRSVKELFRPFLVQVGKMHREKTQGRYFINILNYKIDNLVGEVDYILITDIRYAVYDGDELYWLLTEKCGDLIYIEKKLLNGTYQPSANLDEEKNNPILKKNATIVLEWEEQSDKNNLLNNKNMINYVNTVINELELK